MNSNENSLVLLAFMLFEKKKKTYSWLHPYIAGSSSPEYKSAVSESSLRTRKCSIVFWKCLVICSVSSFASKFGRSSRIFEMSWLTTWTLTCSKQNIYTFSNSFRLCIYNQDCMDVIESIIILRNSKRNSVFVRWWGCFNSASVIVILPRN